MKLTRSPDPGPFSKYGDYKLHLQTLFRQRCAYCISYEGVMGGYDAMEVDHFRPQGRPEFVHLKNEWENLYYCCRRCNLWKNDHWPGAQQQAKRFRFVDPCAEDPDDHLRLATHRRTGDLCWVKYCTPAGKYTRDTIRLNRKQLVDKRRGLARDEQNLMARLKRNRRLTLLAKEDAVKRGSSPEIGERLRLLSDDELEIQQELAEVRASRPFRVF